MTGHTADRADGGATRGDERGAALLLALGATALLSAIALGLALMSTEELRIAQNYRDGVETFYAADAAIERAAQDLAGIPNWSAVLSGATRSSFADATHHPILPSRDTIDLDAVTSQLQTDANAASLGANTPVWTLFAWGLLSQMTALDPSATRSYVAVWIADDTAETDGRPTVDANNTVALHAEAYGAGHAKRVVEATIARAGGSGITIISWRQIR